MLIIYFRIPMEKTLKRIILVTAYYPYDKGEQFLETEINYYNNIDLTIMPRFSCDKKKYLPSQVKLDTSIMEKNPKKIKFKYLIKIFTDPHFYKEFSKESFSSVAKLKVFLFAMYRYRMYYEKFDKYFATLDNTSQIIIYTYWHDTASYALQTLKSKYGYKLISRIHGGDLYKERYLFQYLPLKKQFTENIDTLFTITESANTYLKEVYGFNTEKLRLSRLGVKDNKITSEPSKEGKFYIVSCSFLTEVKQVDKLIYAIHELATIHRDISFSWKHIGTGGLFKKLKELAQKELGHLDNIVYEFLGHYPNAKVYDFYQKNPIDVFINVSSSEGVPVSIMEAMSCHIPIVAPDIGGIRDMVENNKNGILLNASYTIQEIVLALENIEFFKKNEVREYSYKVYCAKYDADKNYPIFIKELIN